MNAEHEMATADGLGASENATLIACLRRDLWEAKRASRKMLAAQRREIDDARKLVELATGESFQANMAKYAMQLDGEAV